MPSCFYQVTNQKLFSSKDIASSDLIQEDCQLCDEALEKLSPHLDSVSLEVIDIEEEGREAEYDKFRYEIPVFFLEKKFLCKNYIDLDKFHSAMEELKGK